MAKTCEKLKVMRVLFNSVNDSERTNLFIKSSERRKLHNLFSLPFNYNKSYIKCENLLPLPSLNLSGS